MVAKGFECKNLWSSNKKCFVVSLAVSYLYELHVQLGSSLSKDRILEPRKKELGISWNATAN